MLETNNLEVGQNIAWKIRERTRGLLGIQAVIENGENMFFPQVQSYARKKS